VLATSKQKKKGNWLGPVMDLFGRLLDLSLENNAFPAALMDLFQKISSRLIKLIVTARPNLSWHYDSQKSDLDPIHTWTRLVCSKVHTRPTLVSTYGYN
jgi:hypothetical protein